MIFFIFFNLYLKKWLNIGSKSKNQNGGGVTHRRSYLREVFLLQNHILLSKPITKSKKRSMFTDKYFLPGAPGRT
jgi:hypothetical protein